MSEERKPSALMIASWRKSSYSNGSQGCVEVATRGPSRLVRDSKNPDKPSLSFSRAAWASFSRAVATGGLDR